jgi:hypothetical protein
MRELDEACSHADEIIGQIQKRLDDGSRIPERGGFLPMHVREIRLQRILALQEAQRNKALSVLQREEQRREVALLIRKSILTIHLQVSRLAGILEGLLEPHH